MLYTFVLKSETVRLKTVDTVHVPSVDSLLLANNIPLANGSIAADVGCGAGLLSVAMAKAGWERIVATDIVGDAVKLTKDNAVTNGVSQQIRTVEADLFVCPKERYDLIVCNPPARPSKNEAMLPPAHRSGADGSSFMSRFASSARGHLLPDGKILVTHSSLVNLRKPKGQLESLGYDVRVVDEIIVPFRLGYFVEYDYLQELESVGHSEIRYHPSGIPLEVVRLLELKVAQRVMITLR
jgi:HemK-related putative methylase